MYVRARLIDGVRQNAILAPQRGIARNERGEPTALVVNRENKVEQRIVVTDRALGDRWVITRAVSSQATG
jgi:membrane fusion protein (multidrug efflux system)